MCWVSRKVFLLKCCFYLKASWVRLTQEVEESCLYFKRSRSTVSLKQSVTKDQGCFSWFCSLKLLMSSYDFVQFHRMISCLHVDFKCFKLVLWPAFRQRFMTIWSFFTRPGDNHDKKMSKCSSTPKLVQAQVFLTFPTTRFPISWFLAKYHSEMKGFFVQ